MRPAQILVEMLLDETVAAFGILYGPGLPAQGYYVTGSTLDRMISKMARAQGVPATGSASACLDKLMRRGFSFVFRNGRTICVYDGGNDLTHLGPNTAKLLQLTPTTAVQVFTEIGRNPESSTVAKTFGYAGRDAGQGRDRRYLPKPGEEARYARFQQAQARQAQQQPVKSVWGRFKNWAGAQAQAAQVRQQQQK